MAGRHCKVGLDYFELDCHMEEKVRLIQAEFGLKGFAVFVKLLQRIYGENGYYCEWTQDAELLFMAENGLNDGSQQLIREIVSACVRRDIFSERLYRKYGILTSSGVQKRYLNATVKREVVSMKKEYLLISVPKNRKNVVTNRISVGINSISDGRNKQSREEKSREENNISCASEMHDTDIFFDEIWKLYPVKRGKSNVSEKQKKQLMELGFDVLKTCIDRFSADMKALERDKKYWMIGSTFFNGGYKDYLDENYEPVTAAKKTGFHNFEQREYDKEMIDKLFVNGGD